MKTDDLENELRNLKFEHLTENELASYFDQSLDQIGRARVETHVKQCFICERQIELLREENAAIIEHVITAEDVAFVERLMEQTGLTPETSAASPAENKGIPFQERLAEYLRQMVASWRMSFGREAVRGKADQGEEVWQWQSADGHLQARATMEKNADLTIHFSSNEMELDGASLKFQWGALNQETTFRRLSESEVAAQVTVPWQYRQHSTADISVEII